MVNKSVADVYRNEFHIRRQNWIKRAMKPLYVCPICHGPDTVFMKLTKEQAWNIILGPLQHKAVNAKVWCSGGCFNLEFNNRHQLYKPVDAYNELCDLLRAQKEVIA